MYTAITAAAMSMGWLFERRGKCRRAADQARLNRAGQTDLSLRAVERLQCLSERTAGRQIERERDRRELALVHDRERSHALVHFHKSSAAESARLDC